MHSGSPATTDAMSDRNGTHKGGKAKRGLIGTLALLNLLLFLVVLGLDGWFFDKAASGNADAGFILGPTSGAGTSSLLLIVVTFFSAVVGVASCLMALLFSKMYTEASRLAAILAALLAFGLAVLAFGFAIKALIQGHHGTRAQNVLIAIAAIDIAMVLMTALLLLALLAAKAHHHHHTTTYQTSGTGGLPVHQQKFTGGHADGRAVHA